MRVVIDGTPLQDDDNLTRVVARLLQVWNEPGGIDELHLMVGSPLHIPVPEWVTVHEVRSARHRLGRSFARTVRVPMLCRSLRAQVLLALRPSVLASVLRPRHTIRYDLWHQPGSEQFAGSDLELDATAVAWAGFARRLRISMVDAVADADWHARRFKINPALLWSRPGTQGEVRRLQIPHRRSVRLIAAASMSTLALSAAAAASVDLVASHNFPVNTPHETTTSVTAQGSSGAAHTTGTTLPGVVQMPTPTTSTPSAPSSAAASTSSSAPATTAPANTKTPSGSSTPLSIPTLTLPTVTLPTVTLPTVTLPSLPLPSLTCTSSQTQTTSLLGVNLCDLNLSKG